MLVALRDMKSSRMNLCGAVTVALFLACGTQNSTAQVNEGTSRAKALDQQAPTDANLKVAFVGDTGAAANFRSVLQLIHKEGANVIMIQGDLGYTAAAQSWFNVLDSEM